MVNSVAQLLIKEHAKTDIDEILETSPSAIKGVSNGDAQHLEAAFGITTIKGMASSRYFQAARAILASSGHPSYDRGPPDSWEYLFAEAPLAHYLTHPSQRFRLEFGPVYYRGRLDGTARTLILGQDPSTNEILAHRIFVGTSGQRIQRLLQKIGIDRSYIMINTFLYSVYGTFDRELKAISRNPEIMGYRNRIIDEIMVDNKIEAVITFGSGAHDAFSLWKGDQQIKWVKLYHPAARAAPENWNAHLGELDGLVQPDGKNRIDLAPFGEEFTLEDRLDIPRFDLPFGVPDWHGTPKGKSQRNGPEEIIWKAPEL
jgi:hypothetical protein